MSMFRRVFLQTVLSLAVLPHVGRATDKGSIPPRWFKPAPAKNLQDWFKKLQFHYYVRPHFHRELIRAAAQLMTELETRARNVLAFAEAMAGLTWATNHVIPIRIPIEQVRRNPEFVDEVKRLIAARRDEIRAWNVTPYPLNYQVLGKPLKQAVSAARLFHGLRDCLLYGNVFFVEVGNADVGVLSPADVEVRHDIEAQTTRYYRADGVGEILGCKHIRLHDNFGGIRNEGWAIPPHDPNNLTKLDTITAEEMVAEFKSSQAYDRFLQFLITQG